MQRSEFNANIITRICQETCKQAVSTIDYKTDLNNPEPGTNEVKMHDNVWNVTKI